MAKTVKVRGVDYDLQDKDACLVMAIQDLIEMLAKLTIATKR